MKEIELHLRKDPILSTIVDKYPLPNLNQSEFIYKNLVKSIISQQLSVKAADTIYSRFADLLSDKINHPKSLIDISHDRLRSVGLSNQKAQYVKNVAQYFKSNNYNWKQFTDQEVITHLTSIKGVGEWTAQMVLMFTMGRPDVFSAGDLSIQQKMVELYDLKESGKQLKIKMKEISKHWKPFRTYACMYLWLCKDK